MSRFSLIVRSQKSKFFKTFLLAYIVATKSQKNYTFCLYGLSAAIGAIRLHLIFLSLFFVGFSQNNSLAKGEKQYEKLAYFDLIKTYEKLLKKGITNDDIHEKLADAYYFNADYAKAVNHYEKLITNNDHNLKKENLFRYALCLKTIGKSSQSENILKKMKELFPEDSRAERKHTTFDDNIFKIEPLNLNTKYSEFGGQAFGNIFVFTSNKPQNKFIERKHSWTNESFLKLYQGEISNNKDILSIKPLRFEKDFPLNESSACITKDGQTLYFTRNIKTKKTTEMSSNILKIYKASLIKDVWSNIEELPFNLDDYNTAHPTLSTDEQMLYFASDRPGGYGDVDLYKVQLLSDGRFSKPENLGQTINTEGKETFPFISADGLLYFASNGHQGLGGLDVFVANISSEQIVIQNLGTSINSGYDDFSFNINPKTKSGFFSSNRIENNQGKDDIYAIKQLKDFNWPNNSQQIFVFDKSNEKPIFEAQIKVKNVDLKDIALGETNKKGSFDFNKLNENEKQIVQVFHDEYEPFEMIINPELKSTKIYLIPKKNTLNIGDDLAKIFSFKQIFFDLDKWFIRKDAEADMHKILQIMQDYADLRIKIRSHTDCRNTFSYNLKLSEKRAIASKQWLIDNGIEDNRLETEALGESELLNNCSCEPKNDSDCSEDEHQANRRSEFIIIK